MRYKQISYTTRILEVIPQDDFINGAQIRARCPVSLNQLSATLHFLRKHQAIDVVIDKDGVGWWFATPKLDQRYRIITEHKPAITGEARKKRKSKVEKTPRQKSIKNGVIK